VKATLTRVFGFGGWSARTLEAKIIHSGTYTNSSNKEGIEVAAQTLVELHIHQLGATYSEATVASQKGADIGEVSDFAMKTAESDGLKRCAINLGTQFGLSLYDAGSTEDVIKVILAPGQKGARARHQAVIDAKKATPEEREKTAASMARLQGAVKKDSAGPSDLAYNSGMAPEQYDAAAGGTDDEPRG